MKGLGARVDHEQVMLFVSNRTYPAINNTVRFQRLTHLASKYKNLYFIGRNDLCEDILSRIKCKITYTRHKEKVYKTIFPLWVLWHVKKLIHKNTISVVNTAWTSNELITGYLIKKVFGIKWVAHLWDDPEKPWFNMPDTGFYQKTFLNFKYQLLTRIVKKILPEADLIIASINPQVIVKKYNVQMTRILAVTNGADLTLGYPTEKQGSDHKFTIGFVGYLMKSRLRLLLEATHLLSIVVPDFKLILLGPYFDKSDIVWIEEELNKLSISNQVEIKPGIHDHNNVLQQLASVDVCVCPYPDTFDISATYPIKLFEYMALGKPIVVTRMWGTSQVIDDGKNGILVDPDDPQDMAEAFIRLHDDEDLRNRISAGAIEQIKNFSWQKINNEISTAIDALV